jgi:hypothetical protein
VGLLTLIVMGEGIIGMTKSVTYVARYSAYTTSATIGVVVAAVSLIVRSNPWTLHISSTLTGFIQYLLWVLYFDQIEHDRFGSIRQQIWAILHYPLHVAIVLTAEGSTQFITWWIAVEHLNYLGKGLDLDTQIYNRSTTAFVNAVNCTLYDFNYRFKKENIPDYNSNLTLIQNLDITIPDDNDQIMPNVFDIFDSLTNWIFKIFGFKLSDGLIKNANDNFDKASALMQAFSTVFLFFLISAGSVLIILGIIYWFGKNHKSRGEIASVFIRILAGVGLALVSASYLTATLGILLIAP